MAVLRRRHLPRPVPQSALSHGQVPQLQVACHSPEVPETTLSPQFLHATPTIFVRIHIIDAHWSVNDDSGNISIYCVTSLHTQLSSTFVFGTAVNEIQARAKRVRAAVTTSAK